MRDGHGQALIVASVFHTSTTCGSDELIKDAYVTFHTPIDEGDPSKLPMTFNPPLTAPVYSGGQQDPNYCFYKTDGCFWINAVDGMTIKRWQISWK